MAAASPMVVFHTGLKDHETPHPVEIDAPEPARGRDTRVTGPRPTRSLQFARRDVRRGGLRAAFPGGRNYPTGRNPDAPT
jgi:hypothetical protein